MTHPYLASGHGTWNPPPPIQCDVTWEDPELRDAIKLTLQGTQAAQSSPRS